jgi:hypothetical protein
MVLPSRNNEAFPMPELKRKRILTWLPLTIAQFLQLSEEQIWQCEFVEGQATSRRLGRNRRRLRQNQLPRFLSDHR